MQYIEILYENDEILAILKPYGVSVQGGEKVENSFIDNIDSFFKCKHYLIHRLDKETEGILLVGKTPQAASRYSVLLNSSDTHKEYRAICIGKPEKKTDVINDMIVCDGRKLPALTKYSLISSNDKFSYLSVVISTGRKHQIRIHLGKNNLPIIADRKYGNFAANRDVKKDFGAKKLMLAAVSLSVPNCLNSKNKNLDLRIPLPQHMTDFLNATGLL